MKIAVITPRASAPVSRSIIDALKQRDVTVLKLNPGRVSLEIATGEPDVVAKYFAGDEPRCAIFRGIGTSRIKKIYSRLGIVDMFETSGVRVINSRRCLEQATNKALTSLALARAGVPTPRTVLCEGVKNAVHAFKALGENVVLKPLFGSKGIGVMHLADEGFASNIFYNLDRMDEVFYLQEYVEHGNSDIRAMVLGDKVLCAMRRTNQAPSNAWKTNVAAGAEGRTITLSKDLERVAVDASVAVDGVFTGVDILETPGGPVVIEVNAVPGFVELQKTTSIDIAQAFVDHVIAMNR